MLFIGGLESNATIAEGRMMGPILEANLSTVVE